MTKIPPEPSSPADIGRAIGTLVEALLNAAGENEVSRVTLGPVQQVREIEVLTGIDISRFHHVVSNQAVAHTIRKHGNSLTEHARGQIAVTHEDFGLLGEITSRGVPSAATPRKTGPQRVKLIAVIGDIEFHYVAQIASRQKRLDMVTMWKKR